MQKLIVGLIICFSFILPANAADIFTKGGSYCLSAQPSSLLEIEDNDELSEEVVRMMSEAVNVADSESWIRSRRAAFTWASEAKVACGKAYGYLRYDFRDDDYLNKCECFHKRMQAHMY